MSENIIVKENLETILKATWSHFLNSKLLLKKVIEDARDNEYRKEKSAGPLSILAKMTITKFLYLGKGRFEVWVEFTVPKDGGIVTGTHTYELIVECGLKLTATYGVHFLT